MATKTFGYGKTYDWSSTYWTTLTNVQNTKITTTTAADGWKVLSFASPTVSTDWDNLTGWTVTDANSEILPAGQLRQHVDSGDTSTNCLRASWLPTGGTITVSQLVKFDNTTWYSGTNNGGDQIRIADASRDQYSILRNNSGKWAYTRYDAGYADETISDVDSDTDRFHIYTYYNNNSADAGIISLDGQEIVTGANDNGVVATNEFYNLLNKGSATLVEHHIDWTKAWNNITPWQTSDGVMESDATNAVFDAGSANLWSTLSWTHDVSNATTLVYQVRCSSSTAGLATATYETIANSGDGIISQNRYIQVKITMSDDSSGRYTPILKDLTLTSAPLQSLEIGGFTAIKPQNNYGCDLGTTTKKFKDGYFGGSVSLVNPVNEFSTDGTLGGNSDVAVPTEKAVKTYVASNVSSGSYTPTLTNTVNIAASTAKEMSWSRVGNVVTGMFNAIIDPTGAAPTQTVLTFTLPIACNTTPVGAGCANDYQNTDPSGDSGRISMVSATTANLAFMAWASANNEWWGTYQYVVN
jgi:hypothetical protein